MNNIENFVKDVVDLLIFSCQQDAITCTRRKILFWGVKFIAREKKAPERIYKRETSKSSSYIVMPTEPGYVCTRRR